MSAEDTRTDGGVAATSRAPRARGFPGYVLGAVLAAAGYLAGTQLVYHFIGYGSTEDGPNFTEQGLVFGFIGLTLGWMVGIGAFNRPITWVLGLRDPGHEANERLAGKGMGIVRYFRFTTDHKVIGIQYLALVLLMLAFGGLGAMLIRVELIRSWRTLLSDSGVQHDRHDAWHADDPDHDHILYRAIR